MKDELLIKKLNIEKDNDIYDVYIHLDTKHYYVRPLYKGTDIEKAREVINRYCDSHIKKVELLRRGCLKRLEKLA